jgi:O-antigen biosynthesis protein WbqP
MKRLIDITIILLFLPIVIIICLIIALLIKIESRGPILFWSDRIGKDNKIFSMPKFRTMQTNTPLIATNNLVNEKNYITKFGKFLRKSSLDELPQLYSILNGKMSLVGPRPALFNQYDLIEMRTNKGIHKLTPGITGWSQVNGRDLISIEKKTELDNFYKENISILLDFKILLITVFKLLDFKEIKH